MFYLIHLTEDGIPFARYYDCIIAATAFAWLTLFIKLIGAKRDGTLHTVLGIRDGNLLRIAMIFTLVADYYLVAAEVENQTMGVTVFIGTQLFIFLHIIVNDSNKKWKLANLTVRLALMVIAVIAAFTILGDEADYLAIISVIYYANLSSNLIFAHRSGGGGIVLTIGLLLFALCDINVGLIALNDIFVGGFPEGSLIYLLVNSEYDLMWLFYIPSQTFIPLTLLLTKNNKPKKWNRFSLFHFLFDKSAKHYNSVAIKNG